MGCGGCRGQVSISLPHQTIKAPTMHPDGSIEYPENQALPDIEGYQLDPEDEHRLVPIDGVGCAWRITGIMLQKDGSYRPHHVCRHSQCEHRSKPVTFDICKGCPLREEG